MDNEINIYVDESGNSGQFKINKENKINDIDKQPFFVNALVVVKPKKVDIATNMYKKVKDFSKENDKCEIKNILTKSNNASLNQLKKMCKYKKSIQLDINIYNKEFYISTLLISHLFCDWLLHINNIVDFYMICNNVFTQKDIIKAYIIFINDKSKENLLNLTHSILTSKELQDSSKYDVLKDKCLNIQKSVELQNKIINFDNEFQKGKAKFQTLIPLHGISEVLIQYYRNDVYLYHDKTCEYEMILKQEIENNMPYIKSVEFVDSKKYELIQVSDNVSHIFNKGMKDLFSKKYSQNTFDKSTFDSFATRTMFDFIKIIGIENIKFTISIYDTAHLHSCFEIYNNQKLEKYYSKIFEEKVNMIINALYTAENIVGGK